MTRLARTTSARLRYGALASVAAAALLSACGTSSSGTSGSTSPSSTPSGSASAIPSGTTSASTAAASAPAATTTAAPGPAACTAAQLRFGTGAVGAGAGQRYLPLTFINVSTLTCTLFGYPGVAGLSSAGVQVTQARRQTGMTRATITLAPGAMASALVQATVVPTGTTSCPPDYAALLVTAPNTRVSVRVAATLPACGGLSVRPVVAGSSGL